jgi:outer membrane receptor protein involved in Fe transport
LAISLSSATVADDAETTQTLDEITVIGATPIAGAEFQLNDLPSSIQTATADEMARQHALDTTAYMDRNFAGVFSNEGQGNPLQNDVHYRGFVASPLLGIPQGLAVYQDGVRINEVFGDTVNWALIPQQAVDRIALMPGSHPAFGLNALGGALSIRTKTGFDGPRGALESSVGSFGRIELAAERGDVFNENFAYFVSGSYMEEDGWRVFSPSDAAHLFGAISWRNARHKVNGSVTYVDIDLIGNGTLPVQLMAMDRRAIFTHPDRTQNDLLMISVQGESRFDDSTQLSWNAYSRDSEIDSLNGDDSDFDSCEELVNLGLVCSMELDSSSETVALDQDFIPIPASSATLGATENMSHTNQKSAGANIQFAREWTAGTSRRNHFLAGAGVDIGDATFFSALELGTLNSSRRAVGSGLLVQSEFTGLETTTSSYNAYIMNSYSPNNRTSFLFSGLYSHVDIELVDGVTHTLAEGAQAFASYSEGSRVPSPVELTCADPDDPCRLPNAFLADPPLQQVVTRTLELGLRGEIGESAWQLVYFRSVNSDDILFISAGQVPSQGYFDNIGDTIRKGVELSLRGAIGERSTWFLNYTRVQAVFGEDFSVASPNHPANVNGAIDVARGDRLPGIPETIAKAGVEIDVTARLTMGSNAVYTSDRILRGDEANLLMPASGGTTVDLFGEFEINSKVLFFFRVDNLLDKAYETFGVLGDAEDVLGDEYDDARFLTPAAPRGAWIGFRISAN